MNADDRTLEIKSSELPVSVSSFQADSPPPQLLRNIDTSKANLVSPPMQDAFKSESNNRPQFYTNNEYNKANISTNQLSDSQICVSSSNARTSPQPQIAESYRENVNPPGLARPSTSAMQQKSFSTPPIQRNYFPVAPREHSNTDNYLIANTQPQPSTSVPQKHMPLIDTQQQNSSTQIQQFGGSSQNDSPMTGIFTHRSDFSLARPQGQTEEQYATGLNSYRHMDLPESLESTPSSVYNQSNSRSSYRIQSLEGLSRTHSTPSVIQSSQKSVQHIVQNSVDFSQDLIRDSQQEPQYAVEIDRSASHTGTAQNMMGHSDTSYAANPLTHAYYDAPNNVQPFGSASMLSYGPSSSSSSSNQLPSNITPNPPVQPLPSFTSDIPSAVLNLSGRKDSFDSSAETNPLSSTGISHSLSTLSSLASSSSSFALSNPYSLNTSPPSAPQRPALVNKTLTHSVTNLVPQIMSLGVKR